MLKESSAKLVKAIPAIMRMRRLLFSCFCLESDKLSYEEYNDDMITPVNVKARIMYDMNIVAPTKFDTGMDVSAARGEGSRPVVWASQDTRPTGRRRESICNVVKYESIKICAAHQAAAGSRCDMEDAMTVIPSCSRAKN